MKNDSDRMLDNGRGGRPMVGPRPCAYDPRDGLGGGRGYGGVGAGSVSVSPSWGGGREIEVEALLVARAEIKERSWVGDVGACCVDKCVWGWAMVFKGPGTGT